MDEDAVEGEGLEQRLLESLGDATAGFLVRARAQDGELVAAQARGGVGRAQHPDEPIPELLEEHVADVVAHGVVELLEAVEVEHEHGRRIVGRGRDAAVERLEERPPVGQAGELVGAGLAAGLGQVAEPAEGQDGPAGRDQQREEGGGGERDGQADEVPRADDRQRREERGGIGRRDGADPRAGQRTGG